MATTTTTTTTTCSIADSQIPLVKHFRLASTQIDAAISPTDRIISSHVRNEFFNSKPIFLQVFLRSLGADESRRGRQQLRSDHAAHGIFELDQLRCNFKLSEIKDRDLSVKDPEKGREGALVDVSRSPLVKAQNPNPFPTCSTTSLKRGTRPA